eukprot:151127_1
MCPLKDRNLLKLYLININMYNKTILYSDEDFHWWPKNVHFSYYKVIPQMKKMAVMFKLPNISSNLLIIDSDLVFIRKMPSFIYPNNSAMYIVLNRTMVKGMIPTTYIQYMDPLLNITVNQSHIAHMMLIQRDILLELYHKIWSNTNYYPLYAATSHFDLGRVSEWELYYTFVKTYFSNRVIDNILPMDASSGDCSKKFVTLNKKYSDIYYTSCHRHWKGYINHHQCLNSKTGCFSANKKRNTIPKLFIIIHYNDAEKFQFNDMNINKILVKNSKFDVLEFSLESDCLNIIKSDQIGEKIFDYYKQMNDSMKIYVCKTVLLYENGGYYIYNNLNNFDMKFNKFVNKKTTFITNLKDLLFIGATKRHIILKRNLDFILEYYLKTIEFNGDEKYLGHYLTNLSIYDIINNSNSSSNKIKWFQTINV